MCFSGGIYLFTLMEWNTASWAIMLIGNFFYLIIRQGRLIFYLFKVDDTACVILSSSAFPTIKTYI